MEKEYRSFYKAFTSNAAAYPLASFPSQTPPSIKVELRIASAGTATAHCEAAWLYSSMRLICLATAR